MALGSNLGNPLEHLRQAVNDLKTQAKAHNLRKSRLYDTDPVGVQGEQPPYLNAVVAFESPLEPSGLLNTLLEIEQKHRRKREYRNSPRTLDLDLLLAGTEQIQQPGLEVPHPRMHLRAFVLAPLADLAPKLQIPGFESTVAELLASLEYQGIRVTPLEW